ncbi:dTDP-4-dehydrorhamnose 3,5-epimerase [Paenibacillus albiflavus]|uniref:dTDP-4-dehydrorhamnose 3,5-epimerase n=1 Tax=Paenibacillus albiflavus TaxID=2545760 RepID=A0A4R4EEW2_9BACL|nr:dTDP-4-dehydrorhamnose 3,5-epimerase [Paenibacillus albiflavus]TCZ76585.1 dTDP-4-dehydrorhamnose 3,5-epimerase [Paenibacillus albiflavus]
MHVIATKQLRDVKIIEPASYEDPRGFFMESYNSREFQAAGISLAFIQDNQSLSKEAGIIRGLHYQLEPKAQTKLVRVLTGAIFDVAVDLRRGSSTFGHWTGVVLSESNRRQLLIPKGFAHGFCTLVPNTQVFYKTDEYYTPECDRGIAWDDDFIGIDWPVRNPMLSLKDRDLPKLDEAEINFTI